MRELKFRVWDKLEERFITCDSDYQGHYVLSLKGEFHNLQNGSGGKEYIVQQYTDFKDKNGKEIYEGDIVKYSRCKIERYTDQSGMIVSKLVEIGEYIGEILYFRPSFCWSYDHKRYDDIEELTGASHRYEIIGNIFENPEPLK